ncbi:hypothetical protein JCM10212_002446 [Sporobolomyces blumeae]
MATLKSALRFPNYHDHASPPPLPPFPPSPPDRPALTSRFSAETLVSARSPPGTRAIQRFFSSTSSHPSPPSSPSSYRRSKSFSAASSPRAKHSPSASESFISISSPRLYDASTDPWGRSSLDEADVLRTPTRTAASDARKDARGRAMSGATAGGAIGAGKDKLAGAAKEVIELLARKKQGLDHRAGHGRKGSATSDRSSETAPRSERGPRSLQTDSPSRPAPPKRRPPPIPSTRPAVPFKLVDLPPRSDSRPAAPMAARPEVAAQAPDASTSTIASSSTGIKGRLRPLAPPSISVPPLHPRPRGDVLLTERVEPRAETPFRALLVSAPSVAEIRSRPPSEILVKLDVGGQVHTTVVETLVHDGRGGKLSEVVEAVLVDIRRQETSIRTYPSNGTERPPLLRIPSSTDDEGDEAGSNVSVTPSHFDVSPHPSPFPFMRYSSLKEDLMSAELGDSGSPIDPFSHQLFLPLPSFRAPPPPLKLDLDPLPVNHQVQIVATPTLAASRHCSVHPVVSNPSPPPTTPSDKSPSRPRRVSDPSAISPLPWTPVDPNALRAFLPTEPELPPSPNEVAARRALAKRLHLSTGSNRSPVAESKPDVSEHDEDINPLESTLEPFFEVLRHQLHHSLPATPSSSSGSTDSSPLFPMSVDRKASNVRERLSLALPEAELPTDAGITTPGEDRSRSTMLGVPRGSVRTRPRRARVDAPGEAVPRVPKVHIAADPALGRRTPDRPSAPSSTPSVVSSECRTSSCRSNVVPTIHVFLDRTDSTLPAMLGTTTYATVLAFLRDGQLPPALSIPTSSLRQDGLDPTTVSILSLNSSLTWTAISSLRAIELEASLLSIGELVQACQRERQRWVDAIRIVETKTKLQTVPVARGMEVVERKLKMRERAQAGWI